MNTSTTDTQEPPVLTDVIEAGLADIEQQMKPASDWRMDVLSAQLPNLIEQAFLNIKPQLMAEIERLIKDQLQRHNNSQ